MTGMAMKALAAKIDATDKNDFNLFIVILLEISERIFHLKINYIKILVESIGSVDIYRTYALIV
jgi:hypothetical protein